MSHQDLEDSIKGDCLKEALRWLLAGISWSSVKFRDDCSYTPRLLACTAMLWAWSNEPTLGEPLQSNSQHNRISVLIATQTCWKLSVFHQAAASLDRDIGSLGSGGFAANECNSPWAVVGRFVDLSCSAWMAAGSSCLEPGRTKRPIRQPAGASRRSVARRQKSRSKKHAKKANSPQMWLTTMWHAGTGLPWDWRTGPADSSERAHMLEMLPALPGGALIAADAGFVGYEYAKAVIDSGRELLVRVGSNVRLLRKLGLVREFQGTVYLWPDQQAKKDQPPIVLRMVVASKWQAPRLFGHKRMHQVATIRLPGDRTLSASLGHRSVLSPFSSKPSDAANYAATAPTTPTSKSNGPSLDCGPWLLYALVQTTKQGLPPNRLSNRRDPSELPQYTSRLSPSP